MVWVLEENNRPENVMLQGEAQSPYNPSEQHSLQIHAYMIRQLDSLAVVRQNTWKPDGPHQYRNMIINEKQYWTSLASARANGTVILYEFLDDAS